MAPALRLILAWLLAVALPMQGVSAATMLACGSVHQSPANVQTHVQTHDHAGIHHVHVADASRFLRSDNLHSAPDKRHLAKTAAHKCSACASCCLSAVATASALSFEPDRLAEFFAPLVARTPGAYVTEGLERPPRSFLA
jgi:hypothetical protein